MTPVEELYVFLGVHPDGSEGVVGGVNNGVAIPLIAADRPRADALLETAQTIATFQGAAVTLVRFVRGDAIQTIEPERVTGPPVLGEGPEGDGR